MLSLASFAAIEESHANKPGLFDPELTTALQTALEEVRAKLGIEYISASIYLSDRCFWEASAGNTRQDPALPIEPDMLFGFGSITKTFVAAIVLQMAEEGKLNLDDSLQKWLPRYPQFDPGITVRRLLNHGSGLGDFYRNRRFQSAVESDPDKLWQPAEILDYEVTPSEQVGSPPFYSNTNYILLGMIIETISGRSLAHELKHRITDPLRLDNTYLASDDFSRGRWSDTTRLTAARFSSVWAAGAIVSNPREIAKWTQTLQGGRFLQPASIEAMRETHPRRVGRHRQLPMGLGVWKLESETFTAWGHGGRFRPFLSATFHIPELGFSLAYSHQWPHSGDQRLAGNRLVDSFLANRPTDLSACFDT